MERLLGDPALAARLAQAGRVHVERTLDIETLTRHMAAHLCELIVKPSPARSAESLPVTAPPQLPEPAARPLEESGISVPNA
jgi:hypothetical protein